MDDGTCPETVSDCDEMAAAYCCVFGGTSGCSENDLVLDYVSESEHPSLSSIAVSSMRRFGRVFACERAVIKMTAPSR